MDDVIIVIIGKLVVIILPLNETELVRRLLKLKFTFKNVEMCFIQLLILKFFKIFKLILLIQYRYSSKQYVYNIR